MNYGKITENGCDINPEYIFDKDGYLCINPTPETLLANGYLEMADNLPDIPPGKMVTGVNYEEREGKIYNVYTFGQRNLSLSKRKLMNELKDKQLWAQAKAYMEQSNKWDDFVMATTLDERDPMLQAAFQDFLDQKRIIPQQLEEIIVNSEL